MLSSIVTETNETVWKVTNILLQFLSSVQWNQSSKYKDAHHEIFVTFQTVICFCDRVNFFFSAMSVELIVKYNLQNRLRFLYTMATQQLKTHSGLIGGLLFILFCFWWSKGKVMLRRDQVFSNNFQLLDLSSEISKTIVHVGHSKSF